MLKGINSAFDIYGYIAISLQALLDQVGDPYIDSWFSLLQFHELYTGIHLLVLQNVVPQLPLCVCGSSSFSNQI